MTRLSSHSTGCSFHVIQSAAVLRGDASRCEQGVGLGSVERPHDDFGEERWPVRSKTLRWGGKDCDRYSRCPCAGSAARPERTQWSGLACEGFADCGYDFGGKSADLSGVVSFGNQTLRVRRPQTERAAGSAAGRAAAGVAPSKTRKPPAPTRSSAGTPQTRRREARSSLRKACAEPTSMKTAGGPAVTDHRPGSGRSSMKESSRELTRSGRVAKAKWSAPGSSARRARGMVRWR